MSIIASINNHLEFTNDIKDLVRKDIIQKLITTRGVLKVLIDNGSKRRIKDKVEYYTNLKLKNTNILVERVADIQNIEIVNTTAAITTSSVQHIQISEYERRILELKEAKLKQQERLKAAELKQQEEMKAAELKQQEEMKAAELKQQEEMKAAELKQHLDLELTKLKQEQEMRDAELKQQFLLQEKQFNLELAKMKQEQEEREKDRQQKKELKELDHAFQREENNKNRDLIKATRYPHLQDNSYYKNTNIRIYGTPATQYLSADDTFKNMVVTSNMALHDINLDFIGSLHNTIKNNTESIPILTKQNTTKTIEAISVENLNNITSCILNNQTLTSTELNKVKYEMAKTFDYFEYLKNESASPSVRVLDSITDYDISIKTTPATFKCLKDREYYRNPINDVTVVNDTYKIKCFVCNNLINLNDKECERLHDIPNSKNGSVEKVNIRLGCSNCNRSMSDTKTVYECKYDIFVERLHQIDEIINESDNEDRSNMLLKLKELFTKYTDVSS